MLVFEKYYHIYNHANGDENLFREQKNYAYFLEKYEQHINPIAETIAWCLMPNHFHLLVKIKTEDEITSTFPKFKTLEKLKTLEAKSNFLSKQFANFFSSYTQSFNKIYERRGSLFLKNFKRKEIVDENYLRNLILYIHLNPIKHGFTDIISDWKWSSYAFFPVIQQAIFQLLFDDEENYSYIHQTKKNHFGEYENLENELT
ncbi:MAG: transposase [Flavobacteriaceae bacterium]